MDCEMRTGKRYDTDVISSIAFFIIAGLDPGSFGRACLALDEKRAYECAHRALMPDAVGSDGQDIVANILGFVEEYVPSHLHDYQSITTWCEHNGLLGADDTTKVMLHLQYGKKVWYLKLAVEPKYWSWVMGVEGAIVPEHEAMIWKPRML
jgi:hypothetical protein